MKIRALTVGVLQTNCYILADDKTKECAVIDPGDEAERILSAAQGYKVKYVILTHGHFDHFEAAEEIREKTGAQTLIDRLDYDLLLSGGESGALLMKDSLTPKIDGFIKDGDELTLGTLKLKIMSTPGHTQGSCVIICDKVIFSGDTLFLESYGRCDLTGGSEEDMRKSLLKLSELPGDYTVLPGHGDRTYLSYERRFNPLMSL
ncbi:MAG: MBL fold metallo-hydrolase [Clostridia bacterium]|nr:MBL fold metallo-hydrolase [Clostridia bacterium]